MIISSSYTFLKLPLFQFSGGDTYYGGRGLSSVLLHNGFFQFQYKDEPLFFNDVNPVGSAVRIFTEYLTDIFNKINPSLDFYNSRLTTMQEFWSMYFQESSLRLIRLSDGKECPIIFTCSGIGLAEPSIFCFALVTKEELDTYPIGNAGDYSILYHMLFNRDYITATSSYIGYSYGRSMYKTYFGGGDFLSSDYFDNIVTYTNYMNSVHPHSNSFANDYSVQKFNYELRTSGCDMTRNSPLFTFDHLSFNDQYKTQHPFQ